MRCCSLHPGCWGKVTARIVPSMGEGAMGAPLSPCGVPNILSYPGRTCAAARRSERWPRERRLPRGWHCGPALVEPARCLREYAALGVERYMESTSTWPERVLLRVLCPASQSPAHPLTCNASSASRSMRSSVSCPASLAGRCCVRNAMHCDFWSAGSEGVLLIGWCTRGVADVTSGARMAALWDAMAHAANRSCSQQAHAFRYMKQRIYNV